MEKEKYKELTKKFTPKENKLRNMIVAFLSGGLMGLLGQLLITFYSTFESINSNEAASLMMVTIIFLSCLFTALGFFDNFVSKLGAGLFVPISGFAHATTSSALEYKKEGLVFGIGSNIFKLSGSVILYGVVSAYIFGIIRFLLEAII